MARKVSVKAVANRVQRQEKAWRDELTTASAAARGGETVSRTRDSFQNFALNLGYGTDNGLSGGSYGYNPISRVRILLEWIHRGSWLGGVAVDLVADDMSRAGIEITSSMDADDLTKLQSAAVALNVWGALGDVKRWASLYGGAIGVLLIDGQDMSTPLRVETVAKNQFRGVYVLDRWMVDPSLNDLVTELGPELGMPKFYRVISDSPALRGESIHHTRVIRMDGIRLPYWQRINEMMWGISVLERIYDRMIAFDSATMGAAQLVYKLYLRTLKLKDFREAVAAGGESLAGVMKQVNLMRQLQSQEGISVIDADDEFTLDQANVQGGISDALVQFAQQLSGALQIPLVRLFGQSPAGLNSTGESDLRTYYDNVLNQQEKFFRVGVSKIYRCMARSCGIKLDENFQFSFVPLWQLTEKERAEVANSTSTAVINAKDAGIIDVPTAMKELKSASKVTGVFGTITDAQIQDAVDNPPDLAETAQTEAGDPPPIDKDGEAPKPPTNPQEVKLKDRAFDLDGLPIQIETPKGTSRPGHSCIVAAHYGYIRGTRGADGDQLDCYVGPALDSSKVWVVDQINPRSGSFDEHKILLGFRSVGEATDAFVSSYHADEGESHIGKITPMSMKKFREEWIPANAPGMRIAA